jgi:hypothetical protein
VPDNFWPTSLLGWLTVGGVLITAMGGFWAFAQSMSRINGLGTRVNELEKDIATEKGRGTEVQRALDMVHIDQTNLRESLARLAVESQTLMKVTQRAEVQRAEDLGAIRTELAFIRATIKKSGHRYINGDDD